MRTAGQAPIAKRNPCAAILGGDDRETGDRQLAARQEQGGAKKVELFFYRKTP
jgi:hypothetical protein